MSPFVPLRRVLAVLLLAAAAACATAGPAPRAAGNLQQDIVAGLTESAAAWNAGDLDGFLKPYLDAPTTTYIERDVVRGVPAIRASYAASWFRGGRPAGELSYSGIEVRPLGPDHALAVGHWRVVMRETGQPRTGIFSLTYQRTAQGWKIVHDHSS
jgi:uncharacterized protein (TIGR02246 family)